jgi:MFS family permease
VLTLPMGVLVDWSTRVRLLWISMFAWAAGEGLSGLSDSFEMLLLIRIGLGATTAAALPAVASLVGDLFPGGERGRIWGLILSGELIGAAFGYVIAGEAATVGSGSWRYAFYVLAVPSFLGALTVRSWLPEPARGGRGALPRGSTRFITAPDAPSGAGAPPGDDEFHASKAQETVEERRVAPARSRVLHHDPEAMSLWGAACYILRIPTNVVLIIASALGYFYFTGVTTFGLVYFEERYNVAHGTATLLMALLGAGGLVGVIVGGRMANSRLRQGDVNSWIVMGALSFALAAVLFLPGPLSTRVAISLPLFILAGAAFGARNPPLDAARLDSMHHRLWGRAEAVRTLLRRTMTAGAPILFGLLADQLVRPRAHLAPGDAHGFGANANANGLHLAFLILLVTLALGGILTFLATRTYARDTATALASEAETASDGHSTRLPTAA